MVIDISPATTIHDIHAWNSVQRLSILSLAYEITSYSAMYILLVLNFFNK